MRTSPSLRSLVAATVLLWGVASVTAVTVAPGPRTASADTPAEALLVGDSVMNAMQQPYGAAARELLGQRHSFVLDSAGCRRLITTSCRIGGRPAPTNALQVVRAHAGDYDRVLVVAAGYNDPTTGSVGLETAVATMIATAHEQGVDHVIWLTYREAGESASRFRAHNALLREQAAIHPELLLADWAAASAAMPSSWFSADGLHLGADAAKGMAQLIADTIDRLPPHLGAEYVPPGPCLIGATPAAAGPFAPSGPTAATIGGAAGAAAPARRLNVVCAG